MTQGSTRLNDQSNLSTHTTALLHWFGEKAQRITTSLLVISVAAISACHAQTFHGTFQSIQVIPGMDSTYRDTTPFVAPDGLSILFSSDRPSTAEQVDWTSMNIWLATRESTSEPFGEAVKLDDSINTDSVGQLDPTMAQGGTALYYFTGSGPGTGDGQIWVSENFGEPRLLGPAVNRPERANISPHVTEDGLTIYFGSAVDGQVNFSLYRATRNSTSEPFVDVMLLEHVSTVEHSENGPSVSPDGLVLFYTTPRGPSGFEELWAATRASVNDPFTNAMDVNELGLGQLNVDNAAEFSPSISADWPVAGSKLYFGRALIEEDWDLYEATWVPELVFDLYADGNVDVADLDLLVARVVAGIDDNLFDLTGDGEIDDRDVHQWLSEAAIHNGFRAAYLSGDANLDGIVNALDLNSLALNWQSSAPGWSSGDFTADGKTDAADLNQLAFNWQDSIRLAAGQPVPEPSAILLVLVGVVVLRGWPLVVASRR